MIETTFILNKIEIVNSWIIKITRIYYFVFSYDTNSLRINLKLILLYNKAYFKFIKINKNKKMLSNLYYFSFCYLLKAIELIYLKGNIKVYLNTLMLQEYNMAAKL